MKALFLSIGTRGDMEPFLAMAELFKSRGWQVACGMPEQFREMVEKRQLPFHGMDRRFIELLESKEGRMIMGQQGSAFKRIGALIRVSKRSLKMQGPMILEQRQMIEEEQPDLVIYHGKCIYPVIWGLSHPGQTIQMSAMPCLVHTMDEYPNIGLRYNLGTRFNRWTYRFVNSIMAITVRRSARHVKDAVPDKKILKPKNVKDFLVNRQAYFYAISPSLFSRHPSWPQHVRITGFRELSKAGNYNPPPDLTDFLKRHKKILFVSFGSMVNDDPSRRTRDILSLISKHKIPTIINTSWGGLEKPELYPGNVLFVSNVPYDWLFPQVYAVIHHGGSGTTHTGLKFGCPSLIIPHIVDQFFWGTHMEKLGVGPKAITIKKLNQKSLEPALLDLWTNESYLKKAKTIEQQMKQEDYAAEIMEAVQKV